MAARYGHAWVSQYGAQPDGLAGAEWRDTLAGVDRTMLHAGFRTDAERADAWPPSSPKFRAMCFGLPTFATVRHEFSHGDEPRTPFGLLCWRFIDTYRLQHADQREADRLVRDAFQLAQAHVFAGGSLPAVHAELAKPEPPVRKIASAETAKRHLDEMMNRLGDVE
jgi:hypothetical protein